jgi:hypothetical protein
MGNELSGSSAGACALSGPPLVDAAGGARPLPPVKEISRRVPRLTTTLRPVVLSGSLQRQPLPHGSGRGTRASTRPLCCCWSPARWSLVAERPGRRGTNKTVSFFISLHPRRPAMGEDGGGAPRDGALLPQLPMPPSFSRVAQRWPGLGDHSSHGGPRGWWREGEAIGGERKAAIGEERSTGTGERRLGFHCGAAFLYHGGKRRSDGRDSL